MDPHPDAVFESLTSHIEQWGVTRRFEPSRGWELGSVPLSSRTYLQAVLISLRVL